MRHIRVAVPVPHLEALTYAVPDGQPLPVIGARVCVPLGKRAVTGVVTGLADLPPEGVATKDISRVLDAEAFVPADVVALGQWVADYYACGAGDAIGAAVPPGALDPSRPSAFRTVRVAHLTAQGHEVSVGEQLAGVVTGERQREALVLLASSPAGLETAGLARRGVSAATLKRLAGAGLVSFTRRQIDRDPFGHASGTARREAVALTTEQAHALDELRAMTQARRFAAVLLHGVTGSGKTEIYLRLAREVAASGRGVILLVPEIALTPAVTAAFRTLFADRVAIQHSGLSD